MSTAYATTHRRGRQLALGGLSILLHVLVFLWFGSQAGRVPDRAAYAARTARTTYTSMAAELVAVPAPAPRLPPPVPPRPALAPPPLPDVMPEPVVATPPASAAAFASPAPAPTPLSTSTSTSGPVPVPPPASGTDDMTAAGGASAVPASAPPTPPGDGTAAAGAASGASRGERRRAAARAARQTGHGGAAGSAGAVQSYRDAQAGMPARAGAEPAASPAAVPTRRYKVDVPPPADITLDVARTDADGSRWSGDALLSWRIAPSGYRIQVEAGIRAVPARVNLLTLVSEGEVGDDGFVPILMTEKRRGRAMTATHFNRQDGTLTFSASAARYTLAPGAQDKASVALQLAAIARGDPQQLSGNIDILVGEDRDASVFTFTVAGRDTIDTRLGPIAAWHLVRPPRPGSYDARLELWLAPAYGWYPVRIRAVEASGAVTTQTVNNIVIKQAGS